MLLPLTPNQSKVLSCIAKFISTNNFPPTITELQTQLSVKNPGAIHKCFCALERKGYIRRLKGQHRGLDLTPEAKELFQ